jgi:hypothetical protein
MADIVNPQITDAVTQTNVKILGDAPGMAMASLYQATGQALGNAAHNATAAGGERHDDPAGHDDAGRGAPVRRRHCRDRGRDHRDPGRQQVRLPVNRG